MGFIKVRFGVFNPLKPDRVLELEGVVDTGAIYTVLPTNLMKELGVKPISKRRFRLANNQVIERDVGLIGIEIKGVKTYTTVVFGDENIYLLGVVTLEELGLEVDPVKGELKPMELLLMRC